MPVTNRTCVCQQAQIGKLCPRRWWTVYFRSWMSTECPAQGFEQRVFDGGRFMMVYCGCCGHDCCWRLGRSPALQVCRTRTIFQCRCWCCTRIKWYIFKENEFSYWFNSSVSLLSFIESAMRIFVENGKRFALSATATHSNVVASRFVATLVRVDNTSNEKLCLTTIMNCLDMCFWMSRCTFRIICNALSPRNHTWLALLRCSVASASTRRCLINQSAPNYQEIFQHVGIKWYISTSNIHAKRCWAAILYFLLAARNQSQCRASKRRLNGYGFDLSGKPEYARPPIQRTYFERKRVYIVCMNEWCYLQHQWDIKCLQCGLCNC